MTSTPPLVPLALLAVLFGCSGDVPVAGPEPTQASNDVPRQIAEPLSLSVSLDRCAGPSPGSEVACDASGGRSFRIRTGVQGTNWSLRPDDPMDPLFWRKLETEKIRLPHLYGCEAIVGAAAPGDPDDLPAPAKYDLSRTNTLLAASSLDTGIVYAITVDYVFGSAVYGPCEYADFGLEEVEAQGDIIAVLEATTHGLGFATQFAAAVQALETYFLNTHLFAKANGYTAKCSYSPGRGLPWYCGSVVRDAEYFRDPFGAGGWQPSQVDELASLFVTLATWKRALYHPTQLGLWAPSLRIFETNEEEAIALLKSFLAAAAKEPPDCVSVELVAGDLDWLDAITDRLVAAAAGMPLGVFGKPCLVFADFRLDPRKVPPHLRADAAAYSAYKGAFVLAAQVLVENRVEQLIFGRTVPSPMSPASDGAQRRWLDADLRWFDSPVAPDGTYTPAAFQAVAISRLLSGQGFAGCFDHDTATACRFDTHESTRKRRLLAVAGMPAGVHGAAVRSNCVDIDGDTTPCRTLPETLGTHIAVPAGLPDEGTRTVRFVIADARSDWLGASDARAISVVMDGFGTPGPKALLRLARSDRTKPFWTDFGFDEQLEVEPSSGKVEFTIHSVGPAMHYGEIWY